MILELALKRIHNYHKKSANETITGKYSLAICYERGEIEQNEYLAFDLHHEAANSGHIMAQVYLGSWYRFGLKVEKDYEKAFNYFSSSAAEGYGSAIIRLGDCYLEGIGTKVDKKKAFDLYLKAANMNEVLLSI